MNAPLLRARSAGELLDFGFQVVRAHYPAVVLATLVFMLPSIALYAVLPIEVVGLANLVSNLMYTYATGAIVVIVSDAYLGHPVSVGRAAKRVLSRFGSLFGASLMQGILVFFGLLLLIVPGILAIAVTFAMPMAVLLEGRTASESFDRSRALVKGEVKRVLVTVGLSYVIFFVALMGISVALGYSDVISNPNVLNVVNELLMVLLYPFPAIVATLLYFDLRIRKEAFDVEVLAQSLGGDAPPQPVYGG